MTKLKITGSNLTLSTSLLQPHPVHLLPTIEAKRRRPGMEATSLLKPTLHIEVAVNPRRANEVNLAQVRFHLLFLVPSIAILKLIESYLAPRRSEAMADQCLLHRSSRNRHLC